MTASNGGGHRPSLDVAIIGMAGRFPGAASVEAFFRNLCEGVESVATLGEGELLAAGVDPALLARPDYVRARAVLDGVDRFDAEFFGFSPREAAALDPQHRLFLECAWEAFENAGYDPERAGGRVGVYAGSSLNGYRRDAFASGARLQSAADISTLLALDKDFLTTRVSYKLNLEGPSVAVQTACSTSLVAVHLACQGLLNGECELALAGGVSIGVPQNVGYLYQEGAIGSPDGHCRAFDARARGTVPGSGVGVILLKRLDDALDDGDAIVAVIKGSAINNDGRKKVGYTAPRVEGQARVVRDAHAAADVGADTIGYVEAHGTGTPMGDPIEVAALTQAFRAGTDKKGFCALGSVKTNVGHLDAAAGIAGLIKAALALAHRRIPPSLHFREPNPAIDFANSPFFVATELREWPDSGAPRRAGVSGFGLGGTNAHVVLEEAPAPTAAAASARPHELVVLSARSREALETLTDALAAHLERGDDLADAAHTLQLGRRAFAHRRALVCRTSHEAARALRARDVSVRLGTAAGGPRPVVFLFPGQGSQYPGMARGPYETEPVFRAEVDECARRLEPALGLDIRTLLFPAPADAGRAAAALARTSMAQPALFTIEYALSRLWASWGLTPEATLGHSVGEYVAACVGGCLSLEDALALVAARGRLMEATAEGAMLAVAAAEDDARSWLGDEIDLAAVNAPRQCVLSGPVAAIERLERDLAGRGVKARRLPVTRAFHSRLMDGIIRDFTEEVARVRLRAPQTAWVSNLTGTWVTPAEAQDPGYWARHLRGAVRFAEGVRALGAKPERILLEVGPGQALSRLCRQVAGGSAPGESESLAFGTLSAEGEAAGASADADGAALLDAAARLWVAGAPLSFSGLRGERRGRRVALPATPFEHKQRHWLDTADLGPHATSTRAERAEARESSPGDVGEWFYAPSWRRAPLREREPDGKPSHWLVFADEGGITPPLVERLEKAGHRVTLVRSGPRFERLAVGAFALRPDRPEDYQALGRELGAGPQWPTHAAHAFGLGEASGAGLDAAGFRRAQGRGALSLLWTARLLGQRPERASLIALANGLHDLTGREALRPEQAPLIGACRSVSLEYPHLRCRLLDLEAARPEPAEIEWLVGRVVAEAQSGGDDAVALYRGRHRWVPSVEPAALDAAPDVPPLLRERGAYLITGGLGGVGLWAADYLARRVRARLLLTGRSPASEEQRARLKALEELGAEVLVVQADVTDVAAMRAAAGRAIERFGALHGLVHAAGVAEGGFIERLTGEALEAELAPKALGALALREIARLCRPDFVLLCSSITALSGGIARAGYAAANAFLDALAHSAAREGGPYTVSVNFDRWRHVGMAARAEARLAALGMGDVILGGMTPEQGQQAFHRVFSQGAMPQVVVSARPLGGLPKDDEGTALAGRLGIGRAGAPSAGGDRSPGAPSAGSDRPPGAAPAPAETLASQVAEIWARAFGLGSVDAGQDFFALGGESLLALQILNRVREAFGVELSLRDFFERPTVAGLAERVQAARERGAGGEGPALVALPRRAKRLPAAEGPAAGPPGGREGPESE